LLFISPDSMIELICFVRGFLSEELLVEGVSIRWQTVRSHGVRLLPR